MFDSFVICLFKFFVICFGIVFVGVGVDIIVMFGVSVEGVGFDNVVEFRVCVLEDDFDDFVEFVGEGFCFGVLVLVGLGGFLVGEGGVVVLVDVDE